MQLVEIQVGFRAVPEGADPGLMQLWIPERAAQPPCSLFPIQVGSYAVPDRAAEGPYSPFPLWWAVVLCLRGRLHRARLRNSEKSVLRGAAVLCL